jgi:radical SAM superfamily enzyme YgiQ (UPF0313 family)
MIIESMKNLNQPESILLVSCYELGHQPAGIAVPAAFLRRAGYSVKALDISVEGFDRKRIERAVFVGISVPMHTALRLGLSVAREIRRVNTEAHICFYGLYASLNAGYLLETVADTVIGGQYEAALVALVKAIDAGSPIEIDGVSTRERAAEPVLARLDFPAPDRSALPGAERYARLEMGGEERLAGYVEASRGCLHMCTHCPIPPVYGGRFFVVPVDTLLEDISKLVLSGVRHITFGDPDFLNGPTHALRLVRAMHERHPELTYDFTAKVEHILKHRELMKEFARAGCIFVVSAVESLSDLVLANLEKGHTRADVTRALEVLRDARIALRPSLVSFTPWTTIDDFIEVLDFVDEHRLIDHVDAVQYSIRLLVPPGSVLLSRAETARWIGRLSQESFTYEWAHPDPAMDELHSKVSQVVERAARTNADAAETFYKVRDLAYAARGDGARRRASELTRLRPRPPRLTEAWFC